METLNYLDRLRRFEQSAIPAEGQPAAAPIVIEPAHPNARPVYWERADGRIYGPGTPEFLARAGDGSMTTYWVVVNYSGQPIWVNTTVLRSKRQFEHQIMPTPFERIKEPR